MSTPHPSIADKRRVFQQLHLSGCFAIPNPWDIGSARMLQGLGFAALAAVAKHLAQVLAQPPAQFHRQFLAARWGVVGRRAIPSLTAIALIATALLLPRFTGDQNAGLMATRLLHWFPRSKKAGGWVYKSWRDWNAECNLSQSQVKRVHGKGFLEAIGIERMLMKANGTPTVHYRLDENKLIHKMAEFLDILQLHTPQYSI